jgi:site-specific recombinase XerD
LQGVELRESLNLKDWDKAQDRIREWEARGMVVAEEEPPLSLSEAQERFRADAEARGLRPATLAKYRGLFTQMQAFARDEGRPFLEQWTLEALRRFRQSWTDGGMSALKKLERLRAFFRFAHESKWIEENPTKAIKNPKVTTPPTLPFTQEEMIAILAACGRYLRPCSASNSVTSIV